MATNLTHYYDAFREWWQTEWIGFSHGGFYKHGSCNQNYGKTTVGKTI